MRAAYESTRLCSRYRVPDGLAGQEDVLDEEDELDQLDQLAS